MPDARAAPVCSSCKRASLRPCSTMGCGKFSEPRGEATVDSMRQLTAADIRAHAAPKGRWLSVLPQSATPRPLRPIAPSGRLTQTRPQIVYSGCGKQRRCQCFATVGRGSDLVLRIANNVRRLQAGAPEPGPSYAAWGLRLATFGGRQLRKRWRSSRISSRRDIVVHERPESRLKPTEVA